VQRISVVGATGSGKTTVAAAIGERLGLPMVELDAIHWGPDWTPIDRAVIRKQIGEVLETDEWVIDGNYRGLVQDLVWAAADTVVWLDLPFRTNSSQLVSRTVRRISGRERLWNDNRESWRTAVFSRDSILWWLIKTHRKVRKRYAHDLVSGEMEHAGWVRLRSRSEVDGWLSSLD